MPPILAETLRLRKVKDAALIAVILLTGVTSFGLGRLSAPNESGTGVSLCTTLATPAVATAASAVDESAMQEVQVSDQGGTPSPTAGKRGYVASRNGSAYHLPWCSGAQRIKEENKVWFATKEDAEAAGYKAAGNCKGI